MKSAPLCLMTALTLALASWATPAYAQNNGGSSLENDPAKRAAYRETIQAFLKKQFPKKDEKKFATEMAKSITSAAHPTGENADLLSYSIDDLKGGLITMRMKVEYYGVLTGFQYTASVRLVVNVSDKDGWDIKTLDFDDDSNKIPPNKQNLADLRRKFNKVLED